MATIQAMSNPMYAPPAKPQSPPRAAAPRAEEGREPAAEARREARTRTEEPAPAASQVGRRIDTTA